MSPFFVCLMVAIAQPSPLPGNPFPNRLLSEWIAMPQRVVVAQSKEFPDAMQWEALSKTARISGLGGELGTAVAIGIRDGAIYFLTANHVVSGIGQRQLEFFTKDSYRDLDKLKKQVYEGVEVSLRISNADLAILRVNLRDRKAPRIVELPQPWDRPKQFPFKALSIGCDDGKSPTCRIEEILGKPLVRRTNEFGAFYWQSSVPSIPGRSGGPLFDSKGRLIGICTATQGGFGYFTHLDEIHAWLKKDGYAWIWESIRKRQ